MTTQAIIELYLRSAGWTKVFTPDGTGDFSWDHDQVEVFETTEEATVITQEWGDLANDDDGPDSEPDCED